MQNRRTLPIISEELGDNLSEFFRVNPEEVNPFDTMKVIEWFEDQQFVTTASWLSEDHNRWTNLLVYGILIQDEDDPKKITHFQPLSLTDGDLLEVE